MAGTYLKIENNAETTLKGDLTDVATSIVVSSVASLPSTFPYLLTIWDEGIYPDPTDDPTAELVLVTSAADTTLTATRGYGDTDGAAHSNGARVALLINKEILTDSTYGIEAVLDGHIDNTYTALDSDRTYYIDDTSGSDENDGLSAEAAFATVERALQEVPRAFSGYNIYLRIIGDYASSVSFYQIRGSKSGQRLVLVGNTEVASAHSISKIRIYGCESIEIRDLTLTSEIDTRNSNAIYVIDCVCGGTAREVGILSIDSLMSVRGTNFGADILDNGIQVNRGSLTVQDNAGSCIEYGILVGIGGQIIGNKNDGVPSGGYGGVYGGIVHNYTDPMSLDFWDQVAIKNAPLVNVPTIRAINRDDIACMHGFGSETVMGTTGSEVIYDSSQNGRHGTNSNATFSKTNGLYGGGFQLDENKYIELDSDLNDVDIASGSFAVCIRVNPNLTALGEENYRFLIAASHDAQVYRYGGNWRFRWFNTSSTDYHFDIEIEDMKWQTVFYIYDSSANTLTGYVFYEDGTYNSNSVNTTGTIKSGDGVFVIGCNESRSSNWLNEACVDDFALFKRTLSVDECRTIHEGRIQFDDIIPSKVLTSPTITSGSGAPSSTPAKIGDIYIDTSTPTMYFAKGTSSSADWIAS